MTGKSTRRPSLARLLQPVAVRPAEFEYDPLRQISVNVAGGPVVSYGLTEIQTFAEVDPDRPEPGTSTKAERDSDFDATDRLSPLATSAGRDAEDPSEPIVVTEAELDPDALSRWGAWSGGASAGTQAGRDAGDPSGPIIVTKSDVDAPQMHRWTTQKINSGVTSTRADLDTDPNPPRTGTKAGRDQDFYSDLLEDLPPQCGQVSDNAATGVVVF
jgi:hypothetical protein